MAREVIYQFADIFVELCSDTDVFSVLLPQYKQFIVGNKVKNFSIAFHLLKEKHLNDSELKPEIADRLISSIGFSPQWIENDYIKHPKITHILNDCIEHINHCQIEFLFDRIVIRDFLLKKINYFYSLPRLSSFSDESFHAIFRNTISPLMPLFSTFLFHGASIVFPDGKASVFFAPDSGGKTTLVSQYCHDRILSDDQLFLNKVKDRFFVHSTPFGRYGFHKAQKGTLSGLFLLEKAKQFSITPIKPCQMIEFLMNEHRLLWFSVPIVYRKAFFNLLTDICYSVPTFVLHFPKTGIDWDAIERVLKH